MKVAALLGVGCLLVGCANITLTEKFDSEGRLVERELAQRCFARVCEVTFVENGRGSEEYEMVRMEAEKESGWAATIAGAVAGLLAGLVL